MNIYGKLAKVQQKLMRESIPKTGEAQNHTYHTLEDILPVIHQKCFEEELTLFFTVIEDAAILKIRTWDSEEGHEEISVRLPFHNTMDTLKTNRGRGMNAMQWEGAMNSYAKRYLLYNTFLICEEELIDTMPEPIESKKSTIKSDKPKEPPKLHNAKNLCKSHDGKITADGVIREATGLRAKGQIDRKQEKEIIQYVHEHGVET